MHFSEGVRIESHRFNGWYSLIHGHNQLPEYAGGQGHVLPIASLCARIKVRCLLGGNVQSNSSVKSLVYFIVFIPRTSSTHGYDSTAAAWSEWPTPAPTIMVVNFSSLWTLHRNLIANIPCLEKYVYYRSLIIWFNLGVEFCMLYVFQVSVRVTVPFVRVNHFVFVFLLSTEHLIILMWTIQSTVYIVER